MSFDSFELSIDGGQPYELYHFFGEGVNFYYTTNLTIVNHLGQNYQPQPIDRTAFELANFIGNNVTSDIILPLDCELSKLFSARYTPSRLFVIVYRGHVGTVDTVIEWRGQAASFETKENSFTIKTVSLLQELSQNEPNFATYSAKCNNTLFDNRCKAIRVNHTLAATITKNEFWLITFDNAFIPDDTLTGGLFKNVTTGELRGISEQKADKLFLNYPVSFSKVGDAIELSLSCNKTLDHCENRFNNQINFNGFLYIPETAKAIG